MSGLISPLARRRYGLARVCSAWDFARSSFYAQAAPLADPLGPAAKIHAKRGPETALDDAALLALIRADLAASPFLGEGHRKVHARLRFVAGHKVGRNRVLRLMREHRLLSPHRAAFAPAKAHEGRITTDAPNVRWATDGAKVWTTDEGWVWLFDLVEHWNGECLGWHVCKIGDRFAAWEPLAQALANTLGGVPGAARGIQLRHDHGSQYLTDFFQSNARFHGFVPSFALLGEPQTNGVVERFHRTLKEQIIHGRTYQNLAQLRAALATFIPTYNQHWRLEKLRSQSPVQARLAFPSTLPLAA
jgi:transposase InsO family protein